MKKVRGYIFSRPFMGERVPQHIQNLVIRDYCSKNNLQYLLSATEYAMADCHLIHQQVMEDLSSVDGVAAYSLFQLPENAYTRKNIYEQIIGGGKCYYFAVEGMRLRNKEDSLRIETIWRVRQTLKNCYLSNL